MRSNGTIASVSILRETAPASECSRKVDTQSLCMKASLCILSLSLSASFRQGPRSNRSFSIAKMASDAAVQSMSTVEYWTQQDEKHVFLKEVLGEPALDWVKERNANLLATMGQPEVHSVRLSVLHAV
jgi:hypothetical protein